MTQSFVESRLDPRGALYDKVLPAGEGWLHELKRGQIFRIQDTKGNQAVDTLFYSAADPSERYSAQDTIRAQRRIYLTTGTRLLSSEGNALLTIVADTCGRHDTLAGNCNRLSSGTKSIFCPSREPYTVRCRRNLPKIDR